jgi:regulator of RNase E activity RraA
MTQPTDSALSDALELFGRLATATISDAMDTLGVPAGCPGLGALVPGTRAVGVAYTVQYAVVEPGGSGGKAPDYLEEAPAGSIIVLANHGRTDCTAWGDLLSRYAQLRGIAGTVVDGAARDLDAIRALGYPVFARTAFMMSGKNRNRMVARQVPVEIAGRACAPDDVVRADGSGVVVVPRGMLAQVVDMARRIDDVEARILEDLEQGVPLAEARARHRYHEFGWKGGA